ncbi:nuclear transport factor 2 family protein [Singulisphaera sp. PoT]|uniref:nuclear transport factor 2 family protein n=1 Tax=Singulisphaera sp. PoT TaxID=3411797 RepID=UPI003BF5CE91
MSTETMSRFLDRIEQAFAEGDAEVGHKATEAGHVRLTREMYHHIIRGDFESAFRNFHDDIELEITGPEGLPFRGRWRGRDEVSRAILENFSGVEEQQPEIQHVVAQGDTVIVIARERGRFKGPGTDYDLHWAQLFTFRDGKAILIRELVDGHSIC